MKRSFEVQIFGQRFTVRSDKDPAFVDRVALLVDERMKALASASANVTPMTTAILAAMNLAEDLLALEDRLQSDQSRMEAVADRIDRELDSLLCT